MDQEQHSSESSGKRTKMSTTRGERQLPTAEREDGAARGLQNTLEKIRTEGNELFRKGDWIGAASKYTACIDRASESESTIANTPRECQNEVMLAYSNRAEARLRLKAYQDALSDSAKALELDPKHVKTLLRKGGAEHALEQFESARKTFAEALALAPENDQSSISKTSISKKLEASEAAYVHCRQSRYGEYDLTNYYLKEKAVKCADYVGPVEIRRVNYGRGRRGLFATQNVTPGQILFVSNPLVIVAQRITSNPISEERFQRDFIRQVMKKSQTSRRYRAQLHSMVLNGEEEMDIPSMELFRPGSEWVSSGTDDLDIDEEAVLQIVRCDVVSHMPDAWSSEDGFENGPKIGLWVLPTFVNHSCAPNCLPVSVGDANIFRASRAIRAGDELTICYCDLWKPVHIRQYETREYFFTCRCERCQFEMDAYRVAATSNIESVVSRRAQELLRSIESIQPEDEWSPNDPPTVALVGPVETVEGMICLRETELEPRQQGWLRASYMKKYIAKHKLEMANDYPTRISSLRLVVDAMSSVGIFSNVLEYAALLLRETELVESTSSTLYKHTEELVLEIFKAFHGEASKDFLLQMIRNASSSENGDESPASSSENGDESPASSSENGDESPDAPYSGCKWTIGPIPFIFGGGPAARSRR